MNLINHILVALLLVVSAFSQSSDKVTTATDFKKLEQIILSLKGLMAQDTVLHTEAIPLEEELRHQVDNIYLDMNIRLPNMDGKLTPEWKEFITQLAEFLEPHEEIILESAYRPQVERNRKRAQLGRLKSDAGQLICFLKPDPEIELLMREKLQQYPTLRWQIYRHLHELRLLRDTDVKEMEALGATISDPKEKIKWAEEISFYGSDLGLDLFEDLLSVPFDSAGAKNERGEPETNKSTLNYGPALTGVINLGTKAKSLLPLVEAREKEMREFYISNFGEEESYRFLVGFVILKRALRGESPPPLKEARNRSGILYPPGHERVTKINQQPDIQTSSSDLSLRPDKRQESTEGSKNSLALKNFVIWLIGLLAIMIGATAVFFFLKSKKPSTLGK